MYSSRVFIVFAHHCTTSLRAPTYSSKSTFHKLTWPVPKRTNHTLWYSDYFKERSVNGKIKWCFCNCTSAGFFGTSYYCSRLVSHEMSHSRAPAAVPAYYEIRQRHPKYRWIRWILLGWGEMRIPRQKYWSVKKEDKLLSRSASWMEC